MFYPLICFTGIAILYLSFGAYGASRTRAHQLCPNCHSRTHIWRAYYINPRNGRQIVAEYDTFYGFWLAGGLALIAAGFLVDILLLFDGLPEQSNFLLWVLALVEIVFILLALTRLLMVLRARGKNLTREFNCLKCGEFWVVPGLEANQGQTKPG